ncbi:hypothetical protein BS50DRAFT_586186 [Corynespora cassiicola Philippines]|uniref:Uncharacterized protein n=1 Tax=Corynespora cassiicola Philippines TaxID=1448308 RepID=A0A2T2NTZ6_CORCC|nr:hypothetical protein BS50DRAFT_586186 [Corynespora cassiicola Philippines]
MTIAKRRNMCRLHQMRCTPASRIVPGAMFAAAARALRASHTPSSCSRGNGGQLSWTRRNNSAWGRSGSNSDDPSGAISPMTVLLHNAEGCILSYRSTFALLDCHGIVDRVRAKPHAQHCRYATQSRSDFKIHIYMKGP